MSKSKPEEVTVINRTKHDRIIRGIRSDGLPGSVRVPARKRKNVDKALVDSWAGEDAPESVRALLHSRRIKIVPLRKRAAAAEPPKPTFPDGDPDKTWLLAELKAFAATIGIDASKCRAKQQVLDLIDPPENDDDDDNDDDDEVDAMDASIPDDDEGLEDA